MNSLIIDVLGKISLRDEIWPLYSLYKDIISYLYSRGEWGDWLTFFSLSQIPLFSNVSTKS
jgi:hypothetical protein